MSKYSAVGALLFAVTLSLPNRSSAYGLKHASNGDYVHWQGRSVSLRIDPALENMLGDGEIRAAVSMASDAWRGFASVPDIAIEKGAPPAYSSSQRGNGIYLLPKWPFESQQLAVTVVTYDQNGDVLGADVLVNGEKSFALLNEGDSVQSDRYDIAAVLTHEFGHVLGLDESYQHPEATMFPQIHQGETRPRLLSNDDQAGVTAIYAELRNQSPAPAAGCSVTSMNAGSNVSTGALFLLVGGLLAARRRLPV